MKLFIFFFQTDKRLIALAIVSSIVSGISSAALVSMISQQLNRVEPLSTNTIAMYASLVVLAIVTNLLARWMLIRLTSHRTYSLRMALIHRILATPLAQFETIGTPRLSAALVEDVKTIALAFNQIPGFFVNIAIVAGCVLYLIWLSPIAFAVLTTLTIPIYFIYKRLHNHAVYLLQTLFRLRDRAFEQYEVLMTGIKELKMNSHRRDNFIAEKIQPTAQAFRQQSIGVRMTYEFANSWSQSAYFVFILALLLLVSSSRVDIQILSGYALIALFMRGAINQLLNVIPQWTQAATALQKIDALALAQPKPNEVCHQNQKKDTPQIAPLCVQVCGVQHSYVHEASDRTFSIGPLDLTLKSGELIFITGANGSGKTTLLKVLASLYQPESGKIWLNDVPISINNREWYRQHFTVIFTDFYLFEDIVGIDNLALNKNANYYLEQLQLAEKVSIQNSQISTLNLSYGQRKRVALLHAYLEDRPICIFDEWAAGQDPDFKELFYRELLPELAGRNKLVIVISHDDQYFSVADRVINMDHFTQP